MDEKDLESHLMEIRKEISKREERLKVMEAEIAALSQKRAQALMKRSDNPLLIKSNSVIIEELKKKIVLRHKALDELSQDLFRAKEREKTVVSEMKSVREGN